MDRMSAIAAEVCLDHGILMNAMPASREELEASDTSIFRNIRRDGVTVS
jgi:hypothetical protein